MKAMLEKDIAENERRQEACNRLMDRIERKLLGWRSFLRPLYQRAINRIQKEYDACDYDTYMQGRLIAKLKCPLHSKCNCGY